jgi:hypothetical protein
MYIKLTNGVPTRYNQEQIRSDNPGTSFPATLTDETLAEFDVYPCEETTQPTYNPATQKIVEATPENIDGAWVQTWAVVALTPEEQHAYLQQLQNSIVQQTQQRLDDFARTRAYDGILSACTYAASNVPKFNTEGKYCVAARDLTWAQLYTIMAEVEAGTRPMPSGYADIESWLPVLAWPS